MQRGGDRGARGVRQPEQVCGSVSQANGDAAGGVPEEDAVVSDWKMSYFSDVNVQGVNSGEYIQILLCLNEGVSWSIADSCQSASIQKGYIFCPIGTKRADWSRKQVLKAIE